MTDLGKLLTGKQERDAIHIAIAPVIANEKLAPGQDIGLIKENRAGVTANPIGIVDPFLKSLVFPEQQFWMFLYPNTITSLRHDWAHPSFDVDIDKDNQLVQKLASRCGISYEDFIAAAKDYAIHGEYFCMGANESYSCVISEEWIRFWEWFSIKFDIELRNIEDKKYGFFSCSC
jgi:hypothetical protein